MGSMCGVGAFLLGNDLVVRGSTTSLPPIYTYLQFSQVAGTDIDFLNNHNFWMCTGSGHFSRERPRKWGLCAAWGHFYSETIWSCAAQQPLYPLYIHIYNFLKWQEQTLIS